MITLLLAMLIFPLVSFGSDQELKICLTGSTEKALPKYGEAFVNGATLAVNQLSALDKKRVKLEVHYYDSNPLAPIAKLEDMQKAACDAIIGFSTGNDLLSIEESLKKNPILTLSIYGDPQERFNKTNYLRTMQPSASDLVGHLFKKLPVKIKKESKVLVVTAADRSEMLSYKEAFLNELKTIVPAITQVEVIEQTHDLRQFVEAIEKEKKWDFVVLLTRSLIAAELSDLIHAQGSPVILGTKYFGSSDLPAFYNYLKNKKVTAYISRQNCSCDTTPEFKKVHDQYLESFKVQPMSISIDSYDATRFILKSLAAKKQNVPEVLKFLNSDGSEFQGVSSVRIGRNFKLSSSKRFLVKIDESGYREVK